MRHLWLGDATTSRPSEISVTHITRMCVLNGLRSGSGAWGQTERTNRCKGRSRRKQVPAIPSGKRTHHHEHKGIP
jgi:hypothetical protein